MRTGSHYWCLTIHFQILGFFSVICKWFSGLVTYYAVGQTLGAAKMNSSWHPLHESHFFFCLLPLPFIDIQVGTIATGLETLQSTRWRVEHLQGQQWSARGGERPKLLGKQVRARTKSHLHGNPGPPASVLAVS